MFLTSPLSLPSPSPPPPSPRFTKLSTQKRHRNRAPLLYARKIITSSGAAKSRPPSDGTQGTHTGRRICFYFAIRTGGRGEGGGKKQEFTLMIRLDPVINTLHGAKGCLHDLCKFESLVWYGDEALKTLNNRWQFEDCKMIPRL